ncbi:MAG: hypothetical protein J6C82_07100 [Clostridia bacterium]|nr:hypothetical protein [Clostridia bacterium]
MEKNKDIYYFSSTHWDREWYQTFQSFRSRLVAATNDLLDILENDKDFGVFHFDGQTIVLEDYAEIEPEKAEKLKQFIKEGKLKVGPWYVMPDEFLLSGESLIRNLMIGHKLAKKWGAEDAWKLGYVCDIFGHIAQMPQIFNGFDITNSLLCRGHVKAEDAYFIWQSPDGSECINFRAGNKDGYGEFCANVIVKPGTMKPDNLDAIKERVGGYLDFLYTATKHHIYIVMDGWDHVPPHRDTVKYIEMIKEAAPDANVHHTDLLEAYKKLEEIREDLHIVKGELNKTGIDGFPQLITNTLSSYYPLKKANDMCQNRLEKVIEPLLVYAKMHGIEINRRYLELAYKYLIENHPHDSICGCSIDQVHKDMEYRFDQTNELCDVLQSSYLSSDGREYVNFAGKESDGIITLYNTLPFEREEVITIDIGMKENYPTTYQEPFGYERINSFRIFDDKGEEILYQIIDIKRAQKQTVYAQTMRIIDIYTITFKAKLPAGGKCEYKVIESKTPARYLKHMKSGMDYMENDYVRVNINSNGSISILDKKTGKLYDNQLNLADDAEIGDGWYHANPKNDSSIYSGFGGCSVEKIESGCSRCVFRITKTMMLPESIEVTPASKKRSTAYKEFTAVYEVGLSENARYCDVKLTIDNNICDHRLRMAIPTNTDSDTYFAGQAFYCCERKDDIDYSTQDWYEYDQYEKAMNGIVGKRDKNGNGLAFVCANGLHECSSMGDENKTLFVTLLRSFSTTVQTNGETRCQLQGEHSYKFILAPIDNTVEYADLVHMQDGLAAEIISVYIDVPKGTPAEEAVSNIKVYGKNICTSIIKRAEDEDAYIVRVFNASDNESEAVIDFAGDIGFAKEVNLNEDDIASDNVSTSGKSVLAKVKPWHIVTVMVGLK